MQRLLTSPHVTSHRIQLRQGAQFEGKVALRAVRRGCRKVLQADAVAQELHAFTRRCLVHLSCKALLCRAGSHEKKHYTCCSQTSGKSAVMPHVSQAVSAFITGIGCTFTSLRQQVGRLGASAQKPVGEKRRNLSYNFSCQIKQSNRSDQIVMLIYNNQNQRQTHTKPNTVLTRTSSSQPHTPNTAAQLGTTAASMVSWAVPQG